MRCEDCKRFYRKDFYPDLKDYGECANPIFREIKTENPEGLFLMPPINDWELYFYVHKNFGCVGFEEK